MREAGMCNVHAYNIKLSWCSVVSNIHVAKFAIDSLINANIAILTFSIKAVL